MSNNNRNNKREHIMNVAETLFAQRGYYGVSVREITDAAETRLASVNYYFESKENLYLEVLARRALPIVLERKQKLDKTNFQSLSRVEAVRQIVLSIVDPLLKKVMTGDLGWRAYATVITEYAARELSPDQDAPEMNEIDRISLSFIEKLDSYSEYESVLQAHLAFQFITTSALSTFANNGRINTLSENRYRSDDYDVHYPASIEFIVGGTLAVLSKS